MKNKIGLGLILLAIMSFAFYLAYQRRIEERNAVEVLNYIENTSINENIDILNEEQKIKQTNEKYKINYTSILEIPSINLKRGMVDSTKDFKSINYAISIDESSNYPNEMGNFILYAHSGNSTIGYFKKLINVNLNDSIYVYYNGIKYHYIVNDKYDIEKNGKIKVINLKNDKYITLITCNQKRKGYQVVMVGKLVEESNY